SDTAGGARSERKEEREYGEGPHPEIGAFNTGSLTDADSTVSDEPAGTPVTYSRFNGLCAVDVHESVRRSFEPGAISAVSWMSGKESVHAFDLVGNSVPPSLTTVAAPVRGTASRTATSW